MATSLLTRTSRQNTGEVIDVEPGEAEYCLEVLESLLKFYFIDPAERARRIGSPHQGIPATSRQLERSDAWRHWFSASVSRPPAWTSFEPWNSLAP